MTTLSFQSVLNSSIVSYRTKPVISTVHLGHFYLVCEATAQCDLVVRSILTYLLTYILTDYKHNLSSGHTLHQSLKPALLLLLLLLIAQQ